jgi:uncharacterized membrane protein
LTVRVLDGLVAATAAGFLGCLAFGWWRPEEVFLAGLALVTVRIVLRPVAVPRVPPRPALAVAVLAYAAGFSFVTVTRHLTFHTHALDLGYYVQLTWNLARGAGPWVSLPEMHAWGDHLSPIMYLLVPAFWVVPGPVVLLVVQSAALAAGALAVFAVARRGLGDERLALAFAGLYLVNPSLHGINVRDFHAAALAVPLLLAAFALAEAGRALPCAAALLLVLACREDAALAVAGFGAWLAVGRRRWLPGAAVAAVALAVLWVDVRWVIPFFRGEPYSHLGRYADLGGSLGEVVLAPLRQPLATAGLLLDLLSRDPVLFHHRSQYQAFVVPFLVVAAVAGHARLARRAAGPWPRRVLVAALLVSLALSSRTLNQLGVDRWWPKETHRAAHRVLARVPEGAVVSAQDPYVPHLALRPRVFVFPTGLDRAEAVVINVAAYPWRSLPGTTLSREGAAVTLVTDGTPRRFTVAAEAGPHLLLRPAD